jgi:uncharacterized protein
MSLRDQLQADLKEAMKAGDELRKNVVRGAMSSLREMEENKRKDLVKKALKKHNVTRPNSQEDEAANAAYQRNMDAALAAENVEAQSVLDPTEELSVIQKLVKQRQESIEQANQAGRADIAENETRELAVLEAYLPAQISREEVEAEARAVISEVGAETARDMGKVMGPLMARMKGRADSKVISEVVRSLLG